MSEDNDEEVVVIRLTFDEPIDWSSMGPIKLILDKDEDDQTE